MSTFLNLFVSVYASVNSEKDRNYFDVSYSCRLVRKKSSQLIALWRVDATFFSIQYMT